MVKKNTPPEVKNAGKRWLKHDVECLSCNSYRDCCVDFFKLFVPAIPRASHRRAAHAHPSVTADVNQQWTMRHSVQLATVRTRTSGGGSRVCGQDGELSHPRPQRSRTPNAVGKQKTILCKTTTRLGQRCSLDWHRAHVLRPQLPGPDVVGKDAKFVSNAHPRP